MSSITITLTLEQADILASYAWAGMCGEPVQEPEPGDENAIDAWFALWRPLWRAKWREQH